MLQILKIIPDDVESDLDGVERIASISASRTATTSRTPPAQAAPSRIVRSINVGAPAQAGNTSGRVIIVADGDEEEEVGRMGPSAEALRRQALILTLSRTS